MAVETKEYRAEAKFQRVSPQKARLVLDLIKGRGVQEALETAAFTKKRIAPVIHKLLTSAVDNAKYVAGEQGHRSGRGQPVREAGPGQRRAAHEAHPSGADGSRLPLPAQADAHRAVGGRARGSRGPGDQGRRSRRRQPKPAEEGRRAAAPKAEAGGASKATKKASKKA